MPDWLYLGIDGGGTACRARLADSAGRTLGEGTAGSANVTLGIEVAAASIRDAAAAAFQAADLSGSEARTHAGFGLAGANVPSLAAGIGAVPFPFASLAVASDAVAACLGAHGGEDGAILILGTGSQGLAIVGGQATAIGGWGFALSDEGSGAVLGRAALRAAVAAADGLAPASPLTEAMLLAYGGSPAEAVLWAATAMPRDYAGFAPLIFERASAGDAVAVALVRDAAAWVAVMLDRLAALSAPRGCLVGGLAAPFRRWLPERFDAWLVPPRGDAMAGALALARQGAPAEAPHEAPLPSPHPAKAGAA